MLPSGPYSLDWKRGEMVDREILNIILCLNVSEEGQAREWQGYAEVPFQDVPSDVILPPPSHTNP